jgi:modulator of FtsH protease
MAAPNLYSQPVAQASAEVRLGFLKRVYAWMAYGIALSAVGTALSIQAGLAEKMLGMGLIGAIVVTAAWMGLGWFANNVRHQPGTNVVAFSLYGLATGIVISSLVYIALIMGQMQTGSSATYVGQAFGVTSLVFGGLSFYAATTKKDFSYLAGFLTVATIALIGLMIIGFFVKSTMFALVVSFGAVLIFSGYVLFNTQKILRTYPENEHMAGAMVLFTDFAILFTHILRIILLLSGSRRD